MHSGRGAPTPSAARRIRPLPRPDNFVELAVFRVVQIFFTFCEFVNNIKYNVILFFQFLRNNYGFEAGTLLGY